MRMRFYSRLLALIVFAGSIGPLISNREWKQHALGRDAYLTHEANFFDKNIANLSHPAAHSIGLAIVFGLTIAIYDLLAFLLYKLINLASKNTPST
jgi:hypothetical protein